MLQLTTGTIARRAIATGGIGLLLATSGASPASAADAPTRDVVSNFSIAMACGAGDNIDPILTFHLETSDAVPPSGRIASGTVHQLFPDDTGDGWTNSIMRDPAWFQQHGQDVSYDVPYFPADGLTSGDYEIDLNYSMGASLVEGGSVSAELALTDGTVIAADTTIVDCFSDNGTSSVDNADVTVRLDVPRTIHMLQYFTIGGDSTYATGDVVRQTWVTSPGIAWDADGRDVDTASDLVLNATDSAALGATLTGTELTLDATQAGTYTLEWGAVTTPIDSPTWTGGYGDRWGPATLTVHVIDAPVRPDDTTITDAARGSVSSTTSTTTGGSLAVNLGDSAAGTYVDVWLHSDPVYLGLFHVPADGTVDLIVPASMALGDHKVIVTDEIGTLVGWDDLSVASGAAPTDDPTATADPTATTGSTNAVPKAATGLDEQSPGGHTLPIALIVAVALLGSGAVVARRRGTSR